jgi:hypothetical protein
LSTLDRLGCFSFLSALASICRMRSRVSENCWPTSFSVWSPFMPMPNRMRNRRSSRGVKNASTRVVVSRRFDWIAASIGRIAFLSSMKSPRCESSSSPTGVSSDSGRHDQVERGRPRGRGGRHIDARHGSRHRLGVGPGIGRFEIYNVVQKHLAAVQFVTPDDDGPEGERALARAGDHRLAAGAIEAPDLAAANATAQRLSALPQVSQTRTLSDLVPGDQDEKLKLIHDAATAIDASLNPREVDRPPTDQEDIEALSSVADALSKVAGNNQGPGADAARRLSELLTQLAEADPLARMRAETAVTAPLRISLDQLRQELKPERITTENIPSDVAGEWVTTDGHARVQVLPKGDPEDTEVLRGFATSVVAVEPNATGPAVFLYEARNTVVRAFIEAGIFALSAIAILLWIALRRMGDVVLTLLPLLVAGVVTLELCAVFDLPLNFANIIALPLLLGVGVAFKVYYIMAWRAGKTALLQSSLTRAVIFSAMTTATAFGSLWLSSQPGTSSMGKLMALALVCTMTAAVLFQPALMGPPREKG